MKKQIIGILILFFLLANTGIASAHFLAIDKNIGAVLHVDPNDIPEADSVSSFFFEFHDKQNTFQPTNCTCTFSIFENGNEIYSQPLFQNNSKPSLENASVFYTFHKIGVYTIQVTGTPESKNGFQPFKLSWIFRVDKQANQNSNKSLSLAQVIPVVVVLIIVVFCIIYAIISVRKKKGGEI